MVSWTDVGIVSVLALASVVVVGVLGYLIDRSTAARDEPEEGKMQEDRR